MDYYLVPERDSDGNETGYYTREPDGVSGMTVSALADFVGASQPGVVSNLLKRVREADPLSNNLPESLKLPSAGGELVEKRHRMAGLDRVQERLV